MKSFTTAFILFLLITFNSYAGWEWQDTLLTKNDLLSIAFVDSTTGWMGGGAGNLFRTTNGGTKWVRQTTGTTADGKDIYDIFIIDSTNFWIAASDGVYNTIDGGKNWKSSVEIRFATFYRVFFIDSMNGWACGRYYEPGPYEAEGLIIKTTDGGKSWIEKKYSPFHTNPFDFYDIQFSDLNNGLAVGQCALYITSDGGNNWIYHNIGTRFFSDIFYIDSKNIWLAEEGAPNGNYLLKSTDGGYTWVDKANKANTFATRVFFADSLNGWVALDDGKIENTTDGGETWADDNSPTNKTINGLFMNSTSSGWAVGDSGTLLKYSFDIDCPVLNAPSNNFHTDSNGISLSWKAVGNAVNYRVRISDSSDFRNSIVDETTPATSFDFNLLKPGYKYYWCVRAMNAKDTSAWSEARSFNTYPETSVPDYKSNDQVLVFPNPTDGIINIGLNKDIAKVQVKVYDVLGGLAFSKDFNDLQKGRTLSLNLSQLNSGMYYIIINTDGKEYSRKLAIIK